MIVPKADFGFRSFRRIDSTPVILSAGSGAQTGGRKCREAYHSSR